MAGGGDFSISLCVSFVQMILKTLLTIVKKKIRDIILFISNPVISKNPLVI